MYEATNPGEFRPENYEGFHTFLYRFDDFIPLRTYLRYSEMIRSDGWYAQYRILVDDLSIVWCFEDPWMWERASGHFAHYSIDTLYHKDYEMYTLDYTLSKYSLTF